MIHDMRFEFLDIFFLDIERRALPASGRVPAGTTIAA